MYIQLTFTQFSCFWKKHFPCNSFLLKYFYGQTLKSHNKERHGERNVCHTAMAKMLLSTVLRDFFYLNARRRMVKGFALLFSLNRGKKNAMVCKAVNRVEGFALNRIEFKEIYNFDGNFAPSESHRTIEGFRLNCV
jgi:hypothetical protein